MAAPMLRNVLYQCSKYCRVISAYDEALISKNKHIKLQWIRVSQQCRFSVSSRQAGNTSSKLILTEKQGKLLLIGINRPEKRNAINSQAAKQLREAFQQLEQDDTVHVGVIYGKGGNFSVGYDLEEASKEGYDFHLNELQTPLGISHLISKPLVAAISGYAVAGGMELALLCDLRLMEDTAVMGALYRRTGIPLVDGGTVRLARQIGLSRALDMILTGRPILAKEALSFGLVSDVVACGTVLGRAVLLAQRIADAPQECLRLDRRSAYYAAYEAKSLEDALEYERKNGLEMFLKESVKVGDKEIIRDGIGQAKQPLAGKPTNE